jgi:3-hydroxyisobutyrate dehydrogenase
VVCATGPQDFAACQVVITMLPNSDAVDSTVRGAPGQPGLLDVLSAGAVVIDMGSSQPLRTQALAQALAGAGKLFLDAPVSGGVKRAVDGSLAIMVGGDAAVFASQRGLLLQLGKVLTHVGPAGAVHAVKALNNYVSAPDWWRRSRRCMWASASGWTRPK